MAFVIVPTATVFKFGDSPQVQLTAKLDGVNVAATWTADDGTLAPASPIATVTLTPDLNELHEITVTAEYLTNEDEATIQIYGVLPYEHIDWGYKPIDEEPADVSVAPDKKTVSIRYNGPVVQLYEFTGTVKSIEGWKDFRDFKRAHRLHKPWYFRDPETDEWHKLRFDMTRWETERRFDSNSYAFIAREYSGAL